MAGQNKKGIAARLVRWKKKTQLNNIGRYIGKLELSGNALGKMVWGFSSLFPVQFGCSVVPSSSYPTYPVTPFSVLVQVSITPSPSITNEHPPNMRLSNSAISLCHLIALF
jgi:hypothetical protein